ncbi:MAG: hypothetical protein Q8R25_03730 [bacterium]|nr:hypothetical protein [bacterium]
MQRIVTNLTAFIERAMRGEDRVLLPRQLETFQKIRDFLEAGYTEGHVVNPTGIGKGVVFTKFVEAALSGLDVKAIIVR